jgi:putative nucleotidyltransferase with HDIG domain
MELHKMPGHIRDHSVVVAKIARVLSRSLSLRGMSVSIERATAGALLHDIGKISALLMGGDHCEIGRRICIEAECHEIAEIVSRHVRFAASGIPENITEEEIVYYADKRVNHDSIVPLEERLAYIVERYGRNNEQIKQAIRNNFSMCRTVEDRLFRNLNFGPDSVSSLAFEETLPLF